MCPGPIAECAYTNAAGDPVLSPPFATQTLVNGVWSAPVVWCPGDALPVPAVTAIRAQAIRLLPHIATGHAFANAALVNTEEVFWAETPTARALPDVTIVGQQVSLRISFDHVTWDFGDGSTDTSTEPGKPYDASDPCTTAQCADYYGHTYRTSGAMTVTATITWAASYRVNGGAWTDIADAITGPATTAPLTVLEARGVLVPNAR